jgi:hypothetical protein
MKVVRIAALTGLAVLLLGLAVMPLDAPPSPPTLRMNGPCTLPVERLSPLPTPLELESGSEVRAGMQVAVKSMRRQGGALRLVYTFRWVGDRRNFSFRRGDGALLLSYWDVNGTRLEGQWFERFTLTDEFLAQEVEVFEGAATLQLPEDANYIAVGLGKSGFLVTRRVAIPARPGRQFAAVEVGTDVRMLAGHSDDNEQGNPGTDE